MGSAPWQIRIFYLALKAFRSEIRRQMTRIAALFAAGVLLFGGSVAVGQYEPNGLQSPAFNRVSPDASSSEDDPTFSSDPGVISAKQRLQVASTAAKDAHAKLAAAKENVLARIQTDPTYLDLEAKAESAQKSMDNARANGTFNEIQKAAQAKAEASSALRKYIEDFGASDTALLKAHEDADAADTSTKAANLQVQQAVARAQSLEAAQRDIRSRLKIDYDKVEDQTTVSFADDHPVLSDVAPVGQIVLGAFYNFKGTSQTNAPQVATLVLGCRSHDWVFLKASADALSLDVLLDGKKHISIPFVTRDDNVDEDAGCNEMLVYRTTYDDLAAISEAQTVSAEVFVTRFDLSTDQLRDIKALFSSMRQGRHDAVPAEGVADSNDPPSADSQAAWSGTGFFVSADGFILTNRHVARDEENPSLPIRLLIHLTGQQRTFEAKVMRLDTDQDLALLKVNGLTGVNFIHFSKPPFLSPGVECSILGFPLTQDLGNSLKFTHGSVTGMHMSGANDPWATDGCDILMDAKSNPGNSGGPIVNKFGELIGILDAKTAAERFQESYTIGIGVGRISDFLNRCNVTIPEPVTNERELSPEDVFRIISPSVVRIEGYEGN